MTGLDRSDEHLMGDGGLPHPRPLSAVQRGEKEVQSPSQLRSGKGVQPSVFWGEVNLLTIEISP